MSAKTTLWLCLFFLFLHESLQKFLLQPHAEITGESSHQQVKVNFKNRRKRSPCVIGTRWRTRRCRKPTQVPGINGKVDCQYV